MNVYEYKNIITSNDKTAVCVWWFNVDQDKQWDVSESFLLPRVSSMDKKIIYGMEQLLLLLVCADDYVLLRRKPELAIIENIKKIRNELPQIIVLDKCEQNEQISEFILSDTKTISFIKNLTTKSNVYLIPYAVFSVEEEIAEVTGATLIGPKLELAQWLNSKINSRNIAKRLGFSLTEGYECCTLEEILNAINSVKGDANDINIVLKDAYGSSGNGFFRIKNESDIFLLEFLVKKMGECKRNFNVLVEIWYENKVDINYQFFISENSITRMVLSYQYVQDGIYNGTQIINAESNPGISKIDEYIKKIGTFLQRCGYRGLCSIDAIWINKEIFIPIIEVNGRFSLSSYISCLDFGVDKIVVSRYYDVSSKNTLESILQLLKQNKLLYDEKKKEGIIIYSFSYGDKKNRVFLLCVFTKGSEIEDEISSILKNWCDFPRMIEGDR